MYNLGTILNFSDQVAELVFAKCVTVVYYGMLFVMFYMFSLFNSSIGEYNFLYQSNFFKRVWQICQILLKGALFTPSI